MIAIAVPSLGRVHTPTMACLIAAISIYREKVVLITPQALVQKARWMAVHQAREAKASHIFWVDSDMTFPPDTIPRLLERRKPIVGAFYSKRDESGQLVGSLQGVHPLYALPAGDLEPCSVLGGGVLLTRMVVFDKVAEPWFEPAFVQGHWLSEDQTFCLNAQKAGFTPHVDLALSREVGHIGAKEFKTWK